MEYVNISPPFISSARPLATKDRASYVREGSRLIRILNEDNFSYGIFQRLGSEESAKANCLSLYYHQIEQQNPRVDQCGFVAIFRQPATATGAEYHEVLKKHIQLMHRLDNRFFEVNPYIIPSIEGDEFEFGFGGRIYGVKDFHPFGENWRKFYDMVALVFETKYNGRRIFPPRQIHSIEKGRRKRTA